MTTKHTPGPRAEAQRALNARGEDDGGRYFTASERTDVLLWKVWAITMTMLALLRWMR